jgi:hypothetical protein
MNNSGAALKNSQRYADLKFSVEEYENEIEQRDLTSSAKTTQPVNLKHFEHSCIGTESCYKQKTIPKFYVEVLKQINTKAYEEKNQKGQKGEER